MRKGMAQQFNQKVENYRRALLYHARTCEWETFKAKAGGMFDYVETIECSELDRRFSFHFNLILAVLAAIAVALFNVDFTVTPELIRLKNAMVVAGLGGSSFELYFYLDYKIYMRVKSVHYAERRDSFIRNIEKDFRNYVREAERKTP